MLRTFRLALVLLPLHFAGGASAGLITFDFTGTDTGAPGGPFTARLVYDPSAPLTSSAGGVNTFANINGKPQSLSGRSAAGVGFATAVDLIVSPTGGGLYRFTAQESGLVSPRLTLTLDGFTGPGLPGLPASLLGFMSGTFRVLPAAVNPIIGAGVIETVKEVVPVATPEPSTLAGAGLASLAGLGYALRRRARRAA